MVGGGGAGGGRMTVGAVAVPLIIGRALKLPPEDVALLVNADLFACGIATLVQSIGIGPFGIRLPVMMGVTFAAVGPIVAIANSHPGAEGARMLFGAIIAIAGCFQGMLVEADAEQVGLRTTAAVVQGIFLVIVLDAFFAVFFTWIGWN